MREDTIQPSTTKTVTLEELGLPVAADIEAMFWNTSNNQVCKAIESWMKTPDCSKLSVETILNAALSINKNREILYMCPNCEAIYQDKVTECDCTVGESPKWIEGFAAFPKK